MFYRYLFFYLFLSITVSTFSQLSFNNVSTDLGLGIPTGTTVWGNGVTFYDFDNDGWDDITLNTGVGTSVRFFKNNNGLFEELELISPPITYQTKQVNWVDIDNDGDKDLFVTSDTNGNRLFENTGNMNLIDITVSAGLPLVNRYTYGASWGDYNNDGYLDVYISNRDETTFTIPNYLYKNNGDNTFTNVSNSVGLNTTAHSSFCSAFFDFNNDGFQDLFVANDRYVYENYLYRNNGDGTFTDIGASSGVGLFMDAMSATIADVNHDGWLDLYVTNTSSGNKFFINNGNETFTNISVSAGTTFNAIAWGSVFLDAENDSDLDLFVSGRLDPNNPTLKSFAFYENQNNGTFIEPSSTGFESQNSSNYSNAIGDINNDGLFDIVVSNNYNDNVALWKNETITTNNYLKVKLEGTTSNRDGVGSKIEININGNKQYRYTLCGEGYLSQNSDSEIFGLGSNTMVDYIKVTWLSGIVDYFYDVSANQLFSIVEGNGTLSLHKNELDTIKLFPNPVKNILNIKTDSAIQYIVLFDTLGNEIKLQNTNNTNTSKTLDLSNLQSGSYFLKITTEIEVENFKIIKE
jgi:hypothetical protein